MKNPIGILLIMMALGACSSGGSESAATTPDDSNADETTVIANGFSESQFNDDPTLALSPHQVGVIHLEHPAGAGHDGDTREMGVDEIPFHVENDQELEFCFENSNGKAHTMALKDAGGNTVLTVTAGGACVTQEIAAGEYTKEFTHDGTGATDEIDPIFIQPVFENVDVATLESLETTEASPSLQPNTDLITTPVCTYLTTWNFQATDGGYLTMNAPFYLYRFQLPVTRDFTTNSPQTALSSNTNFKVYRCAYLYTDNWYALQDASGYYLGETTDSAGNVFISNGNMQSSSGSFTTTVGPSQVFTLRLAANGTDITLQSASGYYLSVENGLVRLGTSTSNIYGVWAFSGYQQPQATSSFTVGTQTKVLMTMGLCQGCNLSNAFFNNTDLRNVDLSDSILQAVYFSNTQLGGANFSHATVNYSTFEDADLNDPLWGPATFEGSSLYQSYFGGADCSDVIFDGSSLTQVGFNGANMTGTSFVNAVQH